MRGQIKIVAAGMAVRKLNAMLRARSFSPTFFTWLEKNCTTSYKGIPWNPGKMILLLFASIQRKKALLYNFLSSLIILGPYLILRLVYFLVFSFNQFVRSVFDRFFSVLFDRFLTVLGRFVICLFRIVGCCCFIGWVVSNVFRTIRFNTHSFVQRLLIFFAINQMLLVGSRKIRISLQIRLGDKKQIIRFRRFQH